MAAGPEQQPPTSEALRAAYERGRTDERKLRIPLLERLGTIVFAANEAQRTRDIARVRTLMTTINSHAEKIRDLLKPPKRSQSG